MINIKQYVLSLRFNFLFKLFNNNYQSSWKLIENRCINKNVLFCILRSNVKLNSMFAGWGGFFTVYPYHLKNFKTIHQCRQ